MIFAVDGKPLNPIAARNAAAVCGPGPRRVDVVCKRPIVSPMAKAVARPYFGPNATRMKFAVYPGTPTPAWIEP
jgi:hypothetical protein